MSPVEAQALRGEPAEATPEEVLLSVATSGLAGVELTPVLRWLGRRAR